MADLERLGDYELIRQIAQGGMADIYLARRADRLVAIKVLTPERAGEPESRAMFIDEALVMTMLDHPNVACVHEVDKQDDVTFLAMEYVHGRDLRDLVITAGQAGHAIPFAAAAAIVAAAAAGLDHAHRRCDPHGRPMHVVHRDVSLSNIMVGHAGEVKVVDFGIARTAWSSHLTNPGVVRGKPSYMSPEQCLGDPLDLRSDVFALGVVLYELTTGQRCFTGTTDFERMLAVVRSEYVPPSVHDLDFPRGVELVIATALAPDPAQRYSSCAAMCEALERLARSEGWATGPDAIAPIMLELYGDVTRPEAIVVPVPATGRRLARGTDRVLPEPTDDDPTRGRRSVPKMFAGWAGRAA